MSPPPSRAKPRPPNPGVSKALLAADKLKGSGEESFEVGMRQAAMEFDALDADSSRTLDFDEFAGLIREREVGIHSEASLRRRFSDADPHNTGCITVGGYIVHAIREAMRRSSANVADLLMAWDADG